MFLLMMFVSNCAQLKYFTNNIMLFATIVNNCLNLRDLEEVKK